MKDGSQYGTLKNINLKPVKNLKPVEYHTTFSSVNGKPDRM